MSTEIFKKIQRCFHMSDSQQIYGRELEQNTIVNFLLSKATSLHITGKPGTGKTTTVKYVLQNRGLVSDGYKDEVTSEDIDRNCAHVLTTHKKNIDNFRCRDTKCRKNQQDIDSGISIATVDSDFVYINYYTSPNINKAIKSSAKPIIVIDEFDKYLEEKKAECIKNIVLIKKRNQKIITISNNLKLSSLHVDLLKFLPYNSDDILNILEGKILNEIGVEIAPKNVLMYISKKFNQTGDLRHVFKFILEIYNRKTNEENYLICLSECIDPKVSNCSETEMSIHHKLISECMDEMNNVQAYKKYLQSCKLLRIKGVDSNDFGIICDLFKE